MIKNKTILICSLPGDYSGVPLYVKRIINGLDREFKFVLLTSSNAGVFDELQCKVIVDEGLKNEMNINSILKNAEILRDAIRYTCPDIVHLNGTMFGLIGRLFSLVRKEKYLFTYHGLPWGRGRHGFFLYVCMFKSSF